MAEVVENQEEFFRGLKPSGLCCVCLTPMQTIDGKWRCPKGCKVTKES